MTSNSRRFGNTDKYGLQTMAVGETKLFHDLTPVGHSRIKRSAHNYNERTDMYFTTKMLGGVLHVTRLR